MKVPERVRDLIEGLLPYRYWTKVDDSDGPNACWLWIGARSPKGYGQLNVAGHNEYAHRLAWVEANGPIPDGLFVLHHCDNPPCVNPAHLWLGSAADNTADMLSKGRARGGSMKGSAHHQAKLTEADVRVIRTLAASGLTNREIARRFNVTDSPIGSILRGETWRHVA